MSVPHCPAAQTRPASIALSGALLAGLLSAAASAPASADPPEPVDPVAGATIASASRGGGPPVPFPNNPHGLPAQANWGRDIEDHAGYQPQRSCAAAPMRGLVALRNLVLRTYGPGSDAGAIRSCAVGGQSEHKEGRAWDWAVDVGDRQERRAAADFLGWLTARGRDGKPGAMARRLGVMYVIYNRKIWSGWSGGWESYSGYSPHTDHVHISLSWNGARGHTSFWTGRVWRTDVGTCAYFANQPAVVATKKERTKACPAPASTPRGSSRSTAWLGNGGSHVAAARRLLGLPAGTLLDRPTRLRIMDWQRRHDLPRTGALDKPTWASLEPRTRRLYAPKWTPAEAASWARDRGSPVLHPTSAGTAVYALQTALRMPTTLRTGYLGQRTKTALVGFRRAHGLGSEPRTNEAVWAELPR